MSRVYSIVVIWIALLSGICLSPVERSVKLSDIEVERLTRLGDDLNRTLSFDIDPCVDFHEYVCGKMNDRKDQMPMNFPKVSQILSEYLQNTKDLNKPELKLKNYWESCKQSTAEDMNIFVRNFDFPESIGGWPAFDSNWNGDKFDLQSAIAELETYFVSVIIDQSFDFDPRTFEKYFSVAFEQIDLLKGRERKEQIETKLLKLGVENVNDVINDVIQFETECDKALDTDRSENEEKLKTNFKGLKEQIPEIDWDKQLKTVVGQTLDNNYSVMITNGDKLKKIIKVVSKMNPKVVANYFFCNFIYYLPELMEDTKEQDCSRLSIESLHSVASGIFIKEFLIGNFEKLLTEMIQSVTENLIKFLPRIKDMSTINVADSIEHLIHGEFTEETLTKEYQDVVIDSNDFYKNMFRLRRHQKQTASRDLFLGQSTKFEIIKHMLTWMFSFNLFGASNQPSPVAFNYIALDIVMAYSQILDVDKLRNETSECIRHQLNVENFEDRDWLGLIAIKVFTKGYIDWANKNDDIVKAEEVILRKYGLTAKKVLLIDVMQYSCGEINDDTKKRITSFFWNTKDFPDIFNCPVGSPMNPEEKCTIIE